MCLNFYRSKIKIFKKTGKIPGVRIRTDKNGRKFFYGYKIVFPSNNSIFFPDYCYKVGINKSSRKNKELTFDEKKYQQIDKGIHVLFKKEHTLSYWFLGRKVICCRCYLDKLVAFNTYEAVLTQVEISSLKDILTDEQKSLYYTYYHT